MATNATSQDGIAPDVLYPLPLFRKISGLGEYALRMARRRGLRVRRSGGRAFVLGADFIAFLDDEDSQTAAE